jgi:hypothetical protein
MCILPKFTYFVVNHYGVIETHHHILNRSFDARVPTVLYEVIGEGCDTIHPNVIVLFGQADDIKATGPK